MKTIDYVGFTTVNQPLPTCPSCGHSTFRTIDTNRSKLAIRRRKQCDHCGHRATTHEVTDEFFQEAKQNQSLVMKMRSVLLKDQPKVEPVVLPVDIKCVDCIHNSNNNECTFGFPEYNTEDSFDCLHYSQSK